MQKLWLEVSDVIQTSRTELELTVGKINTIVYRSLLKLSGGKEKLSVQQGAFSHNPLLALCLVSTCLECCAALAASPIISPQLSHH